MDEERTLKILDKLKSIRDTINKYENKKRFVGAHRHSILDYEKQKLHALKMLEEYSGTVERLSERIIRGSDQIEKAQIWCDDNEKMYLKLKAVLSEEETKLLSKVDKIQDKLKETYNDSES